MTSETTPPEWAIEEACRLSGLEYFGAALHYYTPALIAFARYIAQHEPEPVDVLLMQEAREIVAKHEEQSGFEGLAAGFRNGDYDTSSDVIHALSGLKRGMELAENVGGVA